MAEMLMRLVLSLGLVFALLAVVARVAGRRLKPVGGPLQVLHRQGLAKGSSLAVVAVGERVLLLGATEHQVQLITELDYDDLPEAETVVVGEPTPVIPPALTALARRAVPTRSFDRVLEDATAQAATPAAPPVVVEPVRRPAGPAPGGGPPDGALAGSLLSPSTWRQAAQAVGGRAS